MRTIFLYTYIRNASKTDREIGWPTTTLYDLADPKGEKRIERQDLTARR